MKNKALQILLSSGVAMAALSATPASALVTVVPPPEFQFHEACTLSFGGGCLGEGTFTVTNNSNLYDTQEWIYGFSVGNPFAFADGTTQNNWSASVCFQFSSSGCGIGESEFDYSNNAGASILADDLANDVGPGSSSSNFFFAAGEPASPVVLDLVDSDGNLSFASLSDVPEPFSAAILGSGLLGLAGVMRRRRSKG